MKAFTKGLTITPLPILEEPLGHVGVLSRTLSGTIIQSRLLELLDEVMALECKAKLFATITMSLLSERSILRRSVEDPQMRVSIIIGTEEFCAVRRVFAKVVALHEDKG